MIRYRIPSNLYNFRPMMFGVELRRLLVFFGVSSAGLLLFRFSPLGVLLPILATFILMFITVRGTPISDIMYHHIAHTMIRKRGSIVFDIDFFRHDSRTLFSISSKMYLMMRCSGINLLELSHKNQIQTTRIIQSTLDSLESAVDIVCLPEPLENFSAEPDDEISRFVIEYNYSYVTLLILSSESANLNDNRIKSRLISEGNILTSILSNVNIETSFIDDENVIFGYLEKWLE
jgi:hypothetical protein